MGTPLLGDVCGFIDPLQAASNTQLTTASVNKKFRRIGTYLQVFYTFHEKGLLRGCEG
jgi:hypothetical protein